MLLNIATAKRLFLLPKMGDSVNKCFWQYVEKPESSFLVTKIKT